MKVRVLTKEKYLIFIITNQAGIAKGFIKYKELIKLNRDLLNFFKKRGNDYQNKILSSSRKGYN